MENKYGNLSNWKMKYRGTVEEGILEFNKKFKEVENNLKMEESFKYFVPEISDIHVGYECEYFEPFAGKNQWIKFTFETVSDILDYSETGLKYRELNYRTPYLTKEQIEVEGWEFQKESKHHFKGIKGNYVVDYFDNEHSIVISIDKGFMNSGVLFNGLCPSINEFRTICKLLNI